MRRTVRCSERWKAETNSASVTTPSSSCGPPSISAEVDSSSMHQRAFIADNQSGYLVHFIHEALRQLPGGGAAVPALGGDQVVEVLHYRPHLTKRDQAILVGVKDSENRVPTIGT